MEDLDLDGEGFDTDSRFSMGDNDVELGRMDEEDQLSDQQHRRPLPQGRSKLLASVPVMSAREREAAEAAQRSEAKSQLTKAVNHRLGQGPAASTDVPRKPSMADRFGNSAQLAQDDSEDDYTPASWVTDELDEDL
jgi:hypothetical protein